MQQLVVAMRGQLIEHIPDITQEVNHRGYHVVTFNEKGEAAFGLGKSEYVHSNHHQIPDPTTIPESVVVGKTEDDLPEAMIVKNRYWGIQWHPKEPTIYKKFVEMVKEKGK